MKKIILYIIISLASCQIWANACYAPCKENIDCTKTCGDLWRCGEDGYCTPKTNPPEKRKCTLPDLFHLFGNNCTWF